MELTNLPPLPVSNNRYRLRLPLFGRRLLSRINFHRLSTPTCILLLFTHFQFWCCYLFSGRFRFLWSWFFGCRGFLFRRGFSRTLCLRFCYNRSIYIVRAKPKLNLPLRSVPDFAVLLRFWRLIRKSNGWKQSIQYLRSLSKASGFVLVRRSSTTQTRWATSTG